jgi:hypothetical protein
LQESLFLDAAYVYNSYHIDTTRLKPTAEINWLGI